jgi:hypothetical protein
MAETNLIARLREAKEGSRLLDGQIMFHLFAKPIGNDRGYLWPEDNPSWNFGLVFDKPVSDEVKRRDAREAARNHEKPKDWIQWQREDGRWILMNDLRIPRLTTDLSAAVALLERVLPGWWWRVGTCCVSDDATIGPDYNSPVHGERLRREFPLTPHEDGCGGWLVDVDQRPPHSVAKALTLAILMAKKESGK